MFDLPEASSQDPDQVLCESLAKMRERGEAIPEHILCEAKKKGLRLRKGYEQQQRPSKHLKELFERLWEKLAEIPGRDKNEVRVDRYGNVVERNGRGLTRPVIDHIRPLARGGSNDESNLQIICERANRLKHCNLECEFGKEELRVGITVTQFQDWLTSKEEASLSGWLGGFKDVAQRNRDLSPGSKARGAPDIPTTAKKASSSSRRWWVDEETDALVVAVQVVHSPAVTELFCSPDGVYKWTDIQEHYAAMTCGKLPERTPMQLRNRWRTLTKFPRKALGQSLLRLSAKAWRPTGRPQTVMPSKPSSGHPGPPQARPQREASLPRARSLGTTPPRTCLPQAYLPRAGYQLGAGLQGGTALGPTLPGTKLPWGSSQPWTGAARGGLPGTELLEAEPSWDTVDTALPKAAAPTVSVPSAGVPCMGAPRASSAMAAGIHPQICGLAARRPAGSNPSAGLPGAAASCGGPQRPGACLSLIAGWQGANPLLETAASGEGSLQTRLPRAGQQQKSGSKRQCDPQQRPGSKRRSGLLGAGVPWFGPLGSHGGHEVEERECGSDETEIEIVL